MKLQAANSRVKAGKKEQDAQVATHRGGPLDPPEGFVDLACTLPEEEWEFTDNSHVIEMAKAIFDSAIAFGREFGSTSAAVIAEAIRAIDRNVVTVPCSQPLNPASVDLEHFRRTLVLLCSIAGSDPARIRTSTPKV